MRKVRAGFFLAWLLVSTICSLRALSDSTLLQTYGDAGKKAYEHGQYLEALRMYEAALKECEGLGSQDVRLADNLVNLANSNYALGKYLEAESLLKRAMGIYENAQGGEPSGYAHSINNLATVYCAEGKHLEAEPLYQQAFGHLPEVPRQGQ